MDMKKMTTMGTRKMMTMGKKRDDDHGDDSHGGGRDG